MLSPLNQVEGTIQAIILTTSSHYSCVLPPAFYSATLHKRTPPAGGRRMIEENKNSPILETTPRVELVVSSHYSKLIIKTFVNIK